MRYASYFSRFALHCATAPRFVSNIAVAILFIAQLRDNSGGREKYERVKGDVSYLHGDAEASAIIARDAIFTAIVRALYDTLRRYDNLIVNRRR